MTETDKGIRQIFQEIPAEKKDSFIRKTAIHMADVDPGIRSGTKVRFCPKCGGIDITIFGSITGKRRYFCHECKKTFFFGVTTPDGTVRKERMWRELMRGIEKGLPDRQLSTICGTTEKHVRKLKAMLLPVMTEVKSGQTENMSEIGLHRMVENCSYTGKRYCPLTERTERIEDFCRYCEKKTKAKCLEGVL